MSTAAGSQPVIPTPDGYLRIESDGTIRVLPCDRRLAMTYCVRANLGHDRVRDGIYKPAPVPPNSAFGRFLDYFFPQAIAASPGEACSMSRRKRLQKRNRLMERAIISFAQQAELEALLHLLVVYRVPR